MAQIDSLLEEILKRRGSDLHYLGAKIIIPIKYKTEFTPDLALRGLDEYLAGRQNVRDLKASEFNLTPADIPADPTIYVMSISQ